MGKRQTSGHRKVKNTVIGLLLFSGLLLIVWVFRTKNCTVYGTMADHSMDGRYLTVSKFVGLGMASVKLDSVQVENGRFVFSGAVDEPGLLMVGTVDRVYGKFVAEPGEVRISVPAESYLRSSVAGTPINDDYQQMLVEPFNAYYSVMGPLMQKRDEGMKAGTWTTEDEDAYYDAMSEGLIDRKERMERAFMAKYIGHADVVKEMLSWSLYDEAAHNRRMQDMPEPIPYKYAKENAELLSALSPSEREMLLSGVDSLRKAIDIRLKESPPQIGKIVEIVPDPVQVGKPFTDFSGVTAEGAHFSLRNAVENSKLVLLDFWASWCIPCMRMMPEVAALNEKYREKGLTIVGISSDSEESSWRKAISRAGMTWLQLREDRIGAIYGIRTIPYTILIDREGKIVARALQGKELEETIIQLLE